MNRRNVSQNEVARRAEISSCYLSQLIIGRRSPPAVLVNTGGAEVDRFEDLFVLMYLDN